MKLNAQWHRDNPMPANPSMSQRVDWHLAHAKECGCRDIPKSIQKVIKGKKEKLHKNQ